MGITLVRNLKRVLSSGVNGQMVLKTNKEMNIKSIIAGTILIVLSGCSSLSQPKCDDPDITKRVVEIINENNMKFLRASNIKDIVVMEGFDANILTCTATVQMRNNFMKSEWDVRIAYTVSETTDGDKLIQIFEVP